MTTFRNHILPALVALGTSLMLAMAADNAVLPPATTLARAASGETTPGNDGFIQRWLLLEPIRADGLTDRAVQALVKKEPAYQKPLLDAPEAVRQLNTEFPEISYGEFLQKLQRNKHFAYLRRHLTPRQQYEVNQLGIPGVAFQPACRPRLAGSPSGR